MIIGHQKQLDFLKKIVLNGSACHGFLFYGEPKIGKQKIALEFIKMLNCKEFIKKREPCNICSICVDIEKGRHADVIVVKPKTKEIQIAQIRNIITRLSLSSFQSSFQVVIIDDAHLMNHNSQSALLKTLEEPNKNIIFILITSSPELLSLTILSRLQKIRFTKVTRGEIENFLLKNEFKKEEIKLVSLWSLGRPGVAVDFFRQEDKLEKEKEKRNNFIKLISNSDLISRFNYVKDITLAKQGSDLGQVEDKERVSIFLNDWLIYFRELLMFKIGVLSLQDISPGFKNILSKYKAMKLKNIIETIQKIKLLVDSTNISSKMALEIIMIKLG